MKKMALILIVLLSFNTAKSVELSVAGGKDLYASIAMPISNSFSIELNMGNKDYTAWGAKYKTKEYKGFYISLGYYYNLNTFSVKTNSSKWGVDEFSVAYRYTAPAIELTHTSGVFIKYTVEDIDVYRDYSKYDNAGNLITYQEVTKTATTPLLWLGYKVRF